MERHKESPREESGQNPRSYIEIPSSQESYSEGTPISSRNIELPQFRCPEGTPELSILANYDKPASSSKPEEDKDKDKDKIIYLEAVPLAHGGCEGDAMVDTKLPSDITNTDTLSHALLNNRRFGYCLGREVEQFPHIRPLDSCRKETTLQQKRDVSHCKNTATGTSLQFERSFIADPERQPDSCIVLKKRRRYSFEGTHGAHLPNLPTTGYVSDPDTRLSPSRLIQRRSRSPLKAPSTPRMAFTTTSHDIDFSQMGNATNRSVRISDGARGVQILLDRPERQPSNILRCAQPVMDLQAGMDLSATMLDPQGSSPPESSRGNIPISGPQMGTSLLARRLEESSYESPTHDMEPTRSPSRHRHRASPTEGGSHDSRGLEMWGWSGNLTGWSAEQKSLLLSSWRPSTLKTYRVAWNRWWRWSQDNNVDPSTPSGSSLARFLSDLYQKEGLAYNTILVHKSVVSSLCNADSSEALSSHKLVKQVLKAIALQKPKEPKPPVWDASDLVSFLSSRQIQQNNLYEVTRHTAALLLL